MIKKILSYGDEKLIISKKEYYFMYTVAFGILSLLVYGIFLLTHKSFVYCDKDLGGDGLVQHFNSFVYYGNYLREIVSNFFSEHKLIVPTWDMRIGFGQDIITTLSYYVIGDPFALLSVIFPEKCAEFGYGLAILLRIYCAGITFSVFCSYKRDLSIYTLLGTLVYIFSSYTLYAAILHPYFVLPMIYLPLLLLGVEKIFNKEGDSFFVFGVAISAMSNFYFFYMLCLIVILYVACRYIEKFSFKVDVRLCKYFLRFFFDGLLGMAMAAVLLIPSVMNILTSSRISADIYVPIVYSEQYYFGLLGYFLMGGGSHYVLMGYTGVAFLAVIVLVLQRNKERENIFSLAFAALLLICLCIPYVGHMFNGYSYVTNRWIWAMAFCVAYIVVQALPLVEKTSRLQWKYVWGIVIVCSFFTFVLKAARTKINVIGIIMLIVTVAVVFWAIVREYNIKLILLLLIIFSISINAFAIYSPWGGNYLANFGVNGKALKMLKEDAPEKIMDKIADDNHYRVDTIKTTVKRNSSMQTGRYGTSFYFSSVNPSTALFFRDMAMNYPMEQSYNNLDARTILDYLLGVKYIIVKNGSEKYLPYSYNYLVAQDENYSVYEQAEATSISYSSENYIEAAEYETLSAAQKQEALLQGVVVESSNLKQAELELVSKELDYEVTDLNNVKYENNEFVVSEKDASVSLKFNSVISGELYFVLDGLQFEGTNPETNAVNIKISADGYQTRLNYFNNKNSYYGNKHDFLCNLYFSDNERNSITLTFPETGIYSFSEMNIVFQPMDSCLSNYIKMQEDTLENIAIDANRISGTVDLDKDKLLCLSVPYSEGWKAIVDGKNVEVKRANNAFMAIELLKGKHNITFYYETPWLKEGAMISVIGLLVCVVLILVEKKNRYGFKV